MQVEPGVRPIRDLFPGNLHFNGTEITGEHTPRKVIVSNKLSFNEIATSSGESSTNEIVMLPRSFCVCVIENSWGYRGSVFYCSFAGIGGGEACIESFPVSDYFRMFDGLLEYRLALLL